MSDIYPDGTGGHSGSDTSQARAEHERDSGTHHKRAEETLLFLALKGPTGATWLELSEFLGVHHGAASGILSNLHKAGTISRTPARRHRSKVYVLPQFVGEAVAEPYGGRKVERDYAIKQVEQVRALHQPGKYFSGEAHTPLCIACGYKWPCQTAVIVGLA